MDRQNEVLLFSGGVDSVVAYFYLSGPRCLFFTNLSYRYSSRELESATKFFRNINVTFYRYTLSLGDFEQPDANIPARNVLLLTIGSQYADTVYLVAQRGEDSGPDRCGSFFKRMSQLLTDCHQRKISCNPVFTRKTKQDMVGWYVKSGYPIQYLLDAYSCYTGFEEPCSNCAACFRKFIALEYNGIDTSPIINKNKLLNSSVTHEYVKRMTSSNNPYDKRRTQQTLSVLRKFGIKLHHNNF